MTNLHRRVKLNVKSKITLSLLITRGALICLIILAGALYFSLTVALGSSGQKIKDLKQEQSLLVELNKKLFLKIAEHESPPYVMQRVEGMNLVSVGSFKYIKMRTDSVVAQR